ncbi:MAG TPA: PTS sugar transporter subunit IIA [Ghiorsea sp.]|nr:PTS sugar transporter subunit IIA [Ghiorsea sp.]HIP06642.1 PTS sugar transporter subunit IIA [Mariprofundaceae bacterium]
MLVTPEHVLMGSQAQSKRALLTEMVGLLTSIDLDLALEVITAREKLGSTGMGHGVAIPHGRLQGLQEPAIVIAIHEQGVNFDAIDGQPVHIVVMLLVPNDDHQIHLGLLAKLAKLLQQENVRQALRAASSREDVAKLFAI